MINNPRPEDSSSPIYKHNRHPDCEDGCQLREHKGYDSCWRAGFCHWLAAAPSDSSKEKT